MTASLLTLTSPSFEESDLLTYLMNRLTGFSGANSEAEQFYDGSRMAPLLGISVPPSMLSFSTVAGWPGTTVDVLEERLDWLGWSSDESVYDLDRVYSDNMLDVDSGLAHTDALVYGTTFVTVGAGDDGEPSPLITPQSPKSMTAIWSNRKRRIEAAGAVQRDGEQVVSATLYLPDQTVTLEYGPGRWVVADRDMHRLGRVPVVQMDNRRRGAAGGGRSEITKAVRYYSEAAMRTLLGMEVNREFYSAPQRWAMNTDPSKFVDESGNQVGQWTAIQGRVWMVPPNADGEAPPSVGQFDPASPAPYLDQVKGLAMLLAAEAGIPASYLGFSTDNPASADAIRAGEARLVKRAERRQTQFGRAWLEVARLALLVRDGSVPDDFSNLTVRWRDASTPTRAAAADEATKLIGAGVLPPDSSVTYDRVGLSPAEQRQVMADKRRDGNRALLASLVGPDAVES